MNLCADSLSSFYSLDALDATHIHILDLGFDHTQVLEDIAKVSNFIESCQAVAHLVFAFHNYFWALIFMNADADAKLLEDIKLIIKQ